MWGKTVIVTVGNPLRSDDGVGEYIAELLQERPLSCFVLVRGGFTPENVLEEVIYHNPKKTVIIDAASFGGVPGEVRVLKEEEIMVVMLSTHVFPIPLLARIIAEDTKGRVVFVGIEPRCVAFGQGLSWEVKKTAQGIVKYLEGFTMHELRMVQDLLEDLLQRGREEGLQRITRVYLRVGQLAEIDPEVLRYFFEENVSGTILEGAELVIEESPERELRLVGFEGE
ncbi:MAG: hydrogenase maturation protease [Candidatus Caldatribacteriaceae bacterium]